MNAQWAFYAAAGALTALVMVVLWRSVRLDAAAPVAAHGGDRGIRYWSAATAVGVAALAFGLYGLRGNPDAIDDSRVLLSDELLQQGMPPAGALAEELYQGLQRHLQKQPNDPRALVLKARLDMQSGRYAPAVVAYERAMLGRSKVVNDAGVWVEYAEAMAMQQGRSLVGEPQRLLQKALELNRQHPQALDLAGSAAIEAQDYAAAVIYWERLLALLPPSSPRHAQLKSAIQRAHQLARFALPVKP